MNELKAQVTRAMVSTGEASLQTIARMLKYVHFPKHERILGDSMKVKKGLKRGVLTAVVYLAPGTFAVPYGGANNCRHASPGCMRNCLGHCSGRLAMATSRNAQVWKSLFLHYLPSQFWAQVEREVRALARKAKRLGLIPALRFNGSSDRTEVGYLAELFPGVQFYDYTKNFDLAYRFGTGALLPNHHVTFSLAETAVNVAQAIRLTLTKCNIAVVFKGPLPATFWGRPVIDGDETDVRFQDPDGCVVGLSAKGKARKDTSGFVFDSTKVIR